VGPLPAATARRLACDATVTRVLVTRHPHQPAGDGDHHPAGERSDGDSAVQAADADPATAGLAARLRAAMGLLPRRWVAPDPNRWRWAAPPGWSPHRNGPPWRCGMGAAGSPLVTGRWPGATPTTCATGSTVAPPTWPTWCCCGVGTIMRSTRAAGGCTATLTASSPLPHRPTDDDHPPHKAAA
jgi:hypothetical protein